MANSNRTVLNARRRQSVSIFFAVYATRSAAETVAEAFHHFGIRTRYTSFRIGSKRGKAARHHTVAVYSKI